MRATDCKSYWTEISQSFAFVAALIDPYQFEHQAGNSYYNIWNNKENIVKPPALLFLLHEQNSKREGVLP